MCRAMRNFLNRRVVDPVVDMGRELERELSQDLVAGISPADLALFAAGLAAPQATGAVKATQAARIVAKEGRRIKKGVSAASKLSRKRLSKALREVNAKARKKSGALKKGWSQKRIMQTAQRMARRMK